jgi:aspartate kinase
MFAQFIKTDNELPRCQVDWEQTQKLISKGLKKKALNITQGFLGSDENNFTTTLGREGSDYTAAIFAYCLRCRKRYHLERRSRSFKCRSKIF